jgi:enterochelin esterase-like enzyme
MSPSKRSLVTKSLAALLMPALIATGMHPFLEGILRVRRLFAVLIYFSVCCLFVSTTASAKGTLSGNIIITSKFLGYDLQYRVYTPDRHATGELVPALYVTDGEEYIRNGRLHRVLDREIKSKRIRPVITIFIDARNPHDLSENRRNDQFICNENYAKFYAFELIPAIEGSFLALPDRDARVILGLSYGAYNAACFGFFLPDYFGGIAMQSPGKGYLVRRLIDIYGKGDKLPLKMFLSYSRKNDSSRENRAFRDVLTEQGYDLTYKKSHQGHSWSNWRPLLDDVLLTFFKE